MSLFFAKRDVVGDALGAGMAARIAGGTGSVSVTQETALRHSAVWAALRLRANLVSMMPLDVYRSFQGVNAPVPATPFLTEPNGPGSDMLEWLWSTQFDLDRYGNAFGVITEEDGQGLPRRVELASAADVTVKSKGTVIVEYRIGGTTYKPGKVWHERQYCPAGFSVGLCPIAYAAYSIGGYLSAQKFALDYFGTGGAPTGVLRNKLRPVVSRAVSQEAKSIFKAATEARDIFVTGSEWEWTPAGAPEAAHAFLDEKRYGITDVARFLDVPADLIDGAVGGSSITYASLTQRNLQLLVMSLQATINRREAALSRTLPKPRFVKLNTDAILRMDPETRGRVMDSAIDARRLTVTEARALDNRSPLTPEDEAEFSRLFGSANRTPAPATGVPA